MTSRFVRTGLMTALVAAGASLSSANAHAKPFEEYLRPTPITCSPLSSASWGVAGVVPRDLCNGIESAKGAGVHPDYYYWDGQIIRAKDGKYHLFMSTFSGNTNFGTGWLNSDAYHAISQTSVLGPYERKDYIYTNNGSHKGHNVSAVELPDGTYAVVVSEVVPFTIYKSSSLDGPWTGCQPTSQVGASNISLFPRHDGKFQIVERNGTIAISDTLCGTYVKQKPVCNYTQNAADSIYPKRTSIPGVSNPAYTWQEDPHIWRSAGTYHVIYSGSGDRVGWHLYSADGITWKDNGYAWSPRDYQKIFCYEGTTTCSQWYKMERPGVVLQDGHPTHITWAVADVDKDNQVLPGTNHGTKIIVVPFDGVAFDKDFGVASGGTGSGGASSSGGASPTGGARATGGSSGSGGANPAGGSSGASGSNSTGGNTGSGGAKAAGGSASASGGTSSGTGGAAPLGGSTSASNGGTSNTTTGGQPSMGGAATAAGGARASGGATSGGTVNSAGAPTAGASGSGDSGDNGGCSCRTAGGNSHSRALTALGIVALVGARVRRRRTKAR